MTNHTIKIEIARSLSSDGIWRKRPQHKARTRSQTVMPKPGSHLFRSLIPSWELQHQNCHLDARRNALKITRFRAIITPVPRAYNIL